jgi:lipopolysaccharide/colanic/teichoic acid biosynthesis glycosyltransferase
MFLKRIFDILLSVIALALLFPVLVIVFIWIKADSRGNVFYLQSRVGKSNKDFKIFKFRTMHPDADKRGLLTVGGRDPRITNAGYFLRKYKLDELPQLINVLMGSMSFVGPRPEVRRYVDLYNAEQKNVLNVQPGITDYASIEYSDENELLAKAADPEKEYINTVMPAKLKLNLKYIDEAGILTDLKILWLTFVKVFFK